MSARKRLDSLGQTDSDRHPDHLPVRHLGCHYSSDGQWCPDWGTSSGPGGEETHWYCDEHWQAWYQERNRRLSDHILNGKTRGELRVRKLHPHIAGESSGFDRKSVAALTHELILDAQAGLEGVKYSAIRGVSGPQPHESRRDALDLLKRTLGSPMKLPYNPDARVEESDPQDNVFR